MSLAEKVGPKTDALSLYETIFELEVALKVPRPADEKIPPAICLALADHYRSSRKSSDLDCHAAPLSDRMSLNSDCHDRELETAGGRAARMAFTKELAQENVRQGITVDAIIVTRPSDHETHYDHL